MDIDNQPLVSISCITYNHELFIRQCLDGFIVQECDFDFEILIHDDASTDGTQEIIKEYQEKYPDIIKPIFQTENQYSKGVRGINPRFNYPRAIGKYIALCEGDDYWTDPLKLQKQVDFLENNQLFSACFHIVTDKKNNIVVQTRPSIENSTIYTTAYLLENWNIPTCSFIFRNYPIVFPEFSENVLQGDFTLCLLTSLKGDIYFFKENMAVYNIHEGGISRSIDYRNNINDNMLTFYRAFDKFTHYKYHNNICNSIVRYIFNIQFRHLYIYPSRIKRFLVKIEILSKILWYNRDYSYRFFKIFIGDYLLK